MLQPSCLCMVTCGLSLLFTCFPEVVSLRLPKPRILSSIDKDVGHMMPWHIAELHGVQCVGMHWALILPGQECHICA
jgi:hypothetical protein